MGKASQARVEAQGVGDQASQPHSSPLGEGFLSPFTGESRRSQRETEKKRDTARLAQRGGWGPPHTGVGQPAGQTAAEVGRRAH